MDEPLQVMINHAINQQPRPELVKLVRLYTDTDYGDLETSNGEILEHIRLIGGRTIGKHGILLFLNNDFNDPIVIVDL